MTDPDTTVPELDPDVWYIECDDCHGKCGGCLTCWDTGLVPHPCELNETSD